MWVGVSGCGCVGGCEWMWMGVGVGVGMLLVFCYRTHLDPKYIYVQNNCNIKKFKSSFSLKRFCLEATASFASLNATNHT